MPILICTLKTAWWKPLTVHSGWIARISNVTHLSCKPPIGSIFNQSSFGFHNQYDENQLLFGRDATRKQALLAALSSSRRRWWNTVAAKEISVEAVGVAALLEGNTIFTLEEEQETAPKAFLGKLHCWIYWLRSLARVCDTTVSLGAIKVMSHANRESWTVYFLSKLAVKSLISPPKCDWQIVCPITFQFCLLLCLMHVINPRDLGRFPVACQVRNP